MKSVIKNLKNKIGLSKMDRKWTVNGPINLRVLSRIPSLRFAACVVMMLMMGTGVMWGEACTVYENATGGNVTAGNSTEIFTTGVFENVDGIDSITFTYNAPDNSWWDKGGMKVQYSLDGTNYKDWSEKGKGENRTLTDAIASDHEARYAVSWKFLTRKVSGYHAVWGIKVYKSPAVKLNISSYEFDETAVGGSLYHDFTISTYSMPAGVVITSDSIVISGTNAGLFSCTSISDPDGSCPTERTLRITYSPDEETEGDAKHQATVTVKAGGKTTSMTVYGTASELATPVYTWGGSNTYNVGDDALDLSTVWTSTSDGTITYSITSFTPASGTQTGSTTPAIGVDGKTLSLGKAGTLVLALSQAEGTGYAEGSSSKTITISRHDPVFTWKTQSHYYYNTTVEDFLVKTSGGTCTITSSNEQVAEMDGEDLVIYNKSGSTKIKYIHPETYYWNAKKDSVTLTPEWQSDTVSLSLTDANHTTYESANTFSSGYAYWKDDIDGYFFGATSIGEVSTKRENYAIIHFTGIPDTLYFDQKLNKYVVLPQDRVCYVMVSANGTTWNDTVWRQEAEIEYMNNQKVCLPSYTRYIKFYYNGTISSEYKNIRVSRRKYFKTDKTSLDFGTNIKNTSPAAKTFKFHHASAGYITSVVSSDPTHFTVSPASVTTGGEICDSAVISVAYHPVDEREHSGTITISDNIGNTTSVSVSGETQGKLATHLVYVGSSSYTAVDDNIAATTLFEVRDANNTLVSSPAITLSSSATGVINTVSENTAVDFLCGGSARITASYAGDATYAAASNIDTLITVNKIADEITWNGAVNDTIFVWADDTLPYDLASANTTATKTISFTSSDASVLKVVTGTTKDTLVTLVHDTITLTATTSTDCTYASESSTIVVVVKPCIHKIVWTQDFSGLHTEEDGTIDYTAAMNAYAVDSLDVATRVSVSYSLSPGTTIASIVDGSKLHVTGVGETMVYVTTAADDKYAVVTDSLVVRALTWGENHAKIEQEEFNGNRAWSGPHASFVISGEGQSTTTLGGDGRKLAIEADKVQTISWTVDDGCVINVTSLDLKVGSATLGNGDFNFDGSRIDKIAGWNTNKIKVSNLSLGNDGYMTLSGSKNFNIYYLDITYTITPNVTPSPTDGVSEVNVTLNPLEPVTLDLSDLFDIADAPDDFEYMCDLVSENDHAHIVGAGTQFWADSAGDYTIKGKVAISQDHRPSAWSSTYKTIRVLRRPNKVYMGGSDSYNDTIKLQSTKSGVRLTATNTDYAGSPITCTQIGGVDTISYNPSTGVFTSGNILGTGRWRVSQPQSNQYEAAADTFALRIVNDTYEFTGSTDGAWGKDGNWGASGKPTAKDNVTVSGNLTIEEEIEVYSLTIDEDVTVTITPTGGLNVGAGGISGATTENLILKAETEGATKGQTGYVRISPDYTDVMPNASVELYSIAYYNKNAAVSGSKATYQCVGVPISDAGVRANTVYPTGSWVYTWNESTGSWKSSRASLTFEAFKGFEVTQKLDGDGKCYTYNGRLVSGSSLYTIDLDYTEEQGFNLLANSFAAPISIAQFDGDDFVNANAEIYFLNAGTKNQSVAQADDYDAPGKWVSIPIKTVEELAEDGLPQMIPSMQGFWVRATGESAQLKLDYSRLVWDVDYSGALDNKPLRAPRRSQAEDEEENEEDELPITGKIKLGISSESGRDVLYMLESERYKAAYENGNDAHKLEGEGLEIFTIEGQEQLSVDATNSFVNTMIGIRTGEATAYTFHFDRLRSETLLSLRDYEADQTIDINEGTQYTFFAAPNEEIIGRFQIVERANSPQITTGVESAEVHTNVQKFIKDGQLYVLYKGTLYNVQGKVVK